MSNEVKHNSKILYNLQLHGGCNLFMLSTHLLSCRNPFLAGDASIHITVTF